MTAFGLVRPAVGDDKSARSKYCGPTGKRSAGKLACSVWSGGKAARPYLSLFEGQNRLERDPDLLVAAQLMGRPLARQHHSPYQNEKQLPWYNWSTVIRTIQHAEIIWPRKKR